jgi:hypothetical protein
VSNQKNVQMRRCEGWIVSYPSEFTNWDYRTYREKFFQNCIGDEPAFRKAQRFMRETKEEIKKAEEIELKSLF